MKKLNLMSIALKTYLLNTYSESKWLDLHSYASFYWSWSMLVKSFLSRNRVPYFNARIIHLNLS